MRKALASTALWFLVFDPGINLEDITPQFAAVLPTVERVVRNGTIYAIEEQGEFVYMWILIRPRSQYVFQALVDRLETALGTDPQANEGFFFAGIFDLGGGEPGPDLYQRLYLVHPKSE